MASACGCGVAELAWVLLPVMPGPGLPSRGQHLSQVQGWLILSVHGISWVNRHALVGLLPSEFRVKNLLCAAGHDKAWSLAKLAFLPVLEQPMLVSQFVTSETRSKYAELHTPFTYIQPSMISLSQVGNISDYWAIRALCMFSLEAYKISARQHKYFTSCNQRAGSQQPK